MWWVEKGTQHKAVWLYPSVCFGSRLLWDATLRQAIVQMPCFTKKVLKHPLKEIMFQGTLPYNFHIVQDVQLINCDVMQSFYSNNFTSALEH